MQIHLRDNFEITEDEYFSIIERKTAALTSTACILGAKFAGCDPQTVARLESYGRNVGIAFQIIDDILDVTGTEQEMGKTLGLDAAKGKLTLPMIRYFATADREKRTHALSIFNNGHPHRRQLLRQLLDETDALTYAEMTATRHIKAALENLADLPPSNAKDSLLAVSDFIITRRQ
jgi:octaprenyl-diphosphate synthase